MASSEESRTDTPPSPLIVHTTSPVTKKKITGSLTESLDEPGCVKNEDHRLSSKLAYLRALQTVKLSELQKIEQLLYARSSSASQLESKLIDLERSRAAMVSKSQDLMHDREAKEGSRQGLLLKQEEFQQRKHNYKEQLESTSVQLTESLTLQTSLDSEIENLQDELTCLIQRQHDIDVLLDVNGGTAEAKAVNSKALHSKLKDVKRHLLMVRSETTASREQDTRKGNKSDLTARLELKQEQLEERERELSAQLRMEHADVKELKARMNQKRQDRQDLVVRADVIKQALVEALDKRVSCKQSIATFEEKLLELQTLNCDLQVSSRDAAKILQKLEIRLAELETSSIEIRDHLQEMTQQKLVLHQRLQTIQLASQQLQLNSDALHAEVQALAARIEKSQNKLFRVQGEPLFVRRVQLILSSEEFICGLLTITQSLVIFSPAAESVREGLLYRLCGERTEIIQVEVAIEDDKDVLEIQFVKDLCILHATRVPTSPSLHNVNRFVCSHLISETWELLPSPASSSSSVQVLPPSTTETSAVLPADTCSPSSNPPPSIRKVRFREVDLKVIGEELLSKLPETKVPELPDFELLNKSELLSDDQIRNIVAFAPHRFGASPWRLAYSLTRDGRNLSEFYAAQEGALACLLLFRDSNRTVFGGFTPVAWKQRSGHYGSGESFVFKVGEDVVPYRWSGHNCFFMLSVCGFAMGGGDNFAFSIEANLRDGVSGPCLTYNSPQLSSNSMFSLDYLEAWVPNPDFVSNGHIFRE